MGRHAWDALWEVLAVEHAVKASTPMAEPLMEEEEEEEGKGVEEDKRWGSSPTSDLAPQ